MEQSGKKVGRPKKQINQKQFESLCSIQCTVDEVCKILDVTDKTLNNWCRATYGRTYSEVFAEKRSLGKASLRRMQWKLAEKSATMSIWLGKQYLDQKDEKVIEHSGEIQTTNPFAGLSEEELIQLAGIRRGDPGE